MTNTNKINYEATFNDVFGDINKISKYNLIIGEALSRRKYWEKKPTTKQELITLMFARNDDSWFFCESVQGQGEEHKEIGKINNAGFLRRAIEQENSCLIKFGLRQTDLFHERFGEIEIDWIEVINFPNNSIMRICKNK